MPLEARIAATPSRPLPEGFLPSNCAYSAQDWPVLARQWFPVCCAADALAKPRQVLLLSLRLVVYRLPDGIRVGRDMCPHRGLTLSSGRVEAEDLVCAYHGLRFGPDGQCRKVPDKLASKTVDCYRITLFPAVVCQGLVWTCLIPDGEHGRPGIALDPEDRERDDPSASARLSDQAFIASLRFSSPDRRAAAEPFDNPSLQDLALAEYRRLLDEMGSGSAQDAV
ncbi:MAG: Rieske 2Fe-2S domain-containing protein [Betaproteobacteria bacterium]